MVARIKDSGRDELAAFRSRVLRVAGLGRISKGDADYLVDLVDQIDAHVIKMKEDPDKESSLW
jgi:hypothetical protein